MAKVYDGTGVKIARLPGIQTELDSAAAEILARAKAGAARHADTKHYLKSLKMGTISGPRGVVDREVYSDDPAAIAIEFGHLARGKHGATKVPGHYVLINAVYGAG